MTSLIDSFVNLTVREQKVLEKLWIKVFVDELFLSINEIHFLVLYSNKESQVNTPANMIITTLIIKELLDYSNGKMVENLMLDFHINRSRWCLLGFVYV